MLKFLAILFVVTYVTFKLGGFLMKALQSAAGQDPKQKRKSDGNVNIDYDPNQEKKGNSGYKGGEYVDYEEVN